LHGIPTSRGAASTLIFFGLESCGKSGVRFDVRVVVGFIGIGLRVAGLGQASARISWGRSWGSIIARRRINRLGGAIPLALFCVDILFRLRISMDSWRPVWRVPETRSRLENVSLTT
jgi:hypothetical protein